MEENNANILEVNNVSQPYLGITPLKENLVYEIKMMIMNNPLTCGMIEFLGCGHTTFDTDRHENWTIELRDEYKKNKINAIVFKVLDNEKYNPHKYDYIVVYNNVTKAESSFGYFWYRKSDNKMLSRISLDSVSDVIIRCIVRDINSFKVSKLYEAMNKGLNAIEYDKVYREYIESYRALSYENYIKNTNYNKRWEI